MPWPGCNICLLYTSVLHSMWEIDLDARRISDQCLRKSESVVWSCCSHNAWKMSQSQAHYRYSQCNTVSSLSQFTLKWQIIWWFQFDSGNSFLYFRAHMHLFFISILLSQFIPNLLCNTLFRTFAFPATSVFPPWSSSFPVFQVYLFFLLLHFFHLLALNLLSLTVSSTHALIQE